MSHEDHETDGSAMWAACVHLDEVQTWHVMPAHLVCVCEACLELGPDRIEMADLQTTCPRCLEELIGPIDYSLPGYQVNSASH